MDKGAVDRLLRDLHSEVAHYRGDGRDFDFGNLTKRLESIIAALSAVPVGEVTFPVTHEWAKATAASTPEGRCNPHPDAPHGFDRNGSHNADRYVCECEGWMPPVCPECDGEGWVYDHLGGCGDPECCGGPVQVQCRACDNDWSPDND